MARLELDVTVETLRLAQPFRISGHVFTGSDVVVVTLRDGDLKGRGEGGGVYYLGDDVPHMLYTIGAVRSAIEAGPTREELRSIMPPGGARNAVDCALWELEAARAGEPVWKLAGQSEPQPLRTTFTLGAVSLRMDGLGIGVEAGQAGGAQGGLFHVITHALLSGLAFLAAGALLYGLRGSVREQGALTIQDLSGAATRYPLAALALSVAVLG